MFVSDQIVYLELHKTGCTHIRSVLMDLLGGELIGKHNQIHPDLLGSGKQIWGSVRNPWDWYVSLWSYGCENKGAVFNSVTREKYSLRGLGWRDKPFETLLNFISMRSNNVAAWKSTYSDVNDPIAFREWLSMMNDSHYMGDVGEGYLRSRIGSFSGLMTLRYIRLFCQNIKNNNGVGRILNPEDIVHFDKDNCFVDFFIRNECLESDLLLGMQKLGLVVSEDYANRLRNMPKTNTSSRNRDLNFYYDKASSAIVMERERFIVDKFGYPPPV